jgi:hypothetical protein
MNKDEFKKFFKYISSVTTDTNPSAEKTQVYWDALNDLPFDVAMIAARKVIATLENPFLPMPAVFRGMSAQITGPNIPPAPDAWAEVLRAIRNFGSYREPEALASLNPLIRKAVEAIGYRDLCLSENIDVIRGQFRMAYEALEKRETMDAKTPQSLKEIIAKMDSRFILAPTQEEERKKLIDEQRKEHLLELKKETEEDDEE